MTKNLIIIFLLSIVLWNCSSLKDEDLVVFEYILGTENTKTLNYLVSDFENDFLKNTYPKSSVTEAYKLYLEDVKNENTDHFKKISTKTRKLFVKSLFKYEIYQIPDSVWIERDTSKMMFLKLPYGVLKKRFKFLNQKSEFEYTTSEGSLDSFIKNKDSMLLNEMKIVGHNNVGKYMTALYITRNSSAFLKEYYYRKELSGSLYSTTLADVMLNRDLDFNNPIIRRIIILEMVY